MTALLNSPDSPEGGTLPRKVIVLAPHADDAELGCGGTIARMIEAGVDLTLVAFSTPAGVPRAVIESEANLARETMRVLKDNLEIWDYEVRTMSERRQEILDRLVKLNAERKPDLVLMPSLHDLHQDHQTVANEALRAFKMRSILGYELPWNHLSFNTAAFVPLEERHIERKVLSCLSYISQMGRPFFDADFIRGLARTRGCQIGQRFAEAFEVVRWIIQ